MHFKISGHFVSASVTIVSSDLVQCFHDRLVALQNKLHVTGSTDQRQYMVIALFRYMCSTKKISFEYLDLFYHEEWFAM